MAPRPLCRFLLCLLDPLLLLEPLLLLPLPVLLLLELLEVLEVLEVLELAVLEVLEVEVEVVALLLLVGSCNRNKNLEDEAVSRLSIRQTFTSFFG